MSALTYKYIGALLLLVGMTGVSYYDYVLWNNVIQVKHCQQNPGLNDCTHDCFFEIVESIPDNLTYPSGSPVHTSTYAAWSSLLADATSRADLAVFYWTLLADDVTPGAHYPSAWQGEDVFRQIMDAGLQRNVSLRVAQNAATEQSPQHDSANLQTAHAAQVRDVDIQRLVGGVLHTKLWIVDDDKLYLGSANMDFRALTQVKELGVVLRNCSCLAHDARKIFETYWSMGVAGSILPPHWPDIYSTAINLKNPLPITLNGGTATAFFSSSPPPFSACGRSDDLETIVAVIDAAAATIDIAVMDYFPRTLYAARVKFWPVLDSALRRAALERRVRVRVLASHWQHSRPDLISWLASLQSASNTHWPSIDIQTKLFVVPAFTDEQNKIPFSRVNHNKYMVTDNIAYIGTSNWSEDYFTNTAGVGLVVNETSRDSNDGNNNTTLRAQLQAVFNRDWNSEYAQLLSHFVETP